MCGRYSLGVDPDELESTFKARFSWDYYSPRYNACPGQDLPVVCDQDKLFIHPFRWGLIPGWSKDPKKNQKTFNARSETVFDKASFKGPIKYRHCIVPLCGYYEWKEKQPYRVRRKSQKVFALAGIWDLWTRGDHQVHSFSILTREASPELSDLHHRTPFFLDADGANYWLSNYPKNLAEIPVLPDKEFEYYPVGTAVGNIRNEGPELIVPVKNAVSKRLF